MPKANTNPDAILAAIKKIDILSELLEEKKQKQSENDCRRKEAGRKTQESTVLEIVRPALRLLRSLKKFADRVDATYRSHGLGNTIAQLKESIGDALTVPELVALGNLSQFMAYGKHHLLIKEGALIDRIYLIRSGWVRRVRGVPIYKEKPCQSGYTFRSSERRGSDDSRGSSPSRIFWEAGSALSESDLSIHF